VWTAHVAHIEELAKEKPVLNIFGIHETAENNFNPELLGKTLWEKATRKLRKKPEIL
jgi:hypothetical protein